jgi:rifampicin phosphotransferase
MTTSIDRTLVSSLAAAPVPEDAGGKAANLGRLIGLGHPVPDGVVISRAALDDFLREHDLAAPIERICAELDPRSPAAIRSAADTIAALVRDCGISLRLRAELDEILGPLSSDALIVRSSAIGEDSHDASFAGQLDSVPDVIGAAAVRRAIVDVWASRWSTRALTYQLARDKPLAGVAVVVQRQIASAISGVLFTVSPGSESEMLLEYCGGSGESLVSGRENPGRLTISRRDLAWSRQASPEREVAQEDRLLTDDGIRALARRALAIEHAFGGPQDIEWTMDGDGRIWIVQTRPITAKPARARERPRPAHWSNANVNENFPAPISPLLYSIARAGYYHYFRNLGSAFGFSDRRLAAMETPLRQIIGVHGARMYYNLSSIHGVLRSAPFGEQLAAWFNTFVGSEDTDAPPHVDVPGARLRHWSSIGRPGLQAVGQAAELAAIAAHTVWQFLFLTRRVARFERTVDDFAARTHPDRLRERGRDALLDDMRAFIDIRNNRWKDASLADAASMVCYGALERSLRRAFPGEDQASLHNSLLKALPDLPSSMPAVKLWELSRLVRGDDRLRSLLASASSVEALDAISSDPGLASFKQALDRFLEDWGFRCSGELMLTVASFQEDSAPVLDLLKAYASMESASPAEQLEIQRAERLRQTARISRELRRRRLVRAVPGLHQWHLISRLLVWTERAIVLRERARLKQALLYSRLRRIALTLGQRLADEGTLDRADDIFFLTAPEIDDLVSGYAMFSDIGGLVALRRKAHADLSASAPPDSMRLNVGEYWAAPASSGASGAGSSAMPWAGPRLDLRGVGVCGGSATGRAAVIADVTQAHMLQPGDVLITRQTDPGWGAIFPLISGLVMERGGMLSHGAIIAREFGIPSIVGVADATRLVPHGAVVHVDGDRGVLGMERPAC